jgi:hypothetical protein
MKIIILDLENENKHQGKDMKKRRFISHTPVGSNV